MSALLMALLIFPGLLFTLLGTLIMLVLIGQPIAAVRFSALRTPGGLVALVSILCSAYAIFLLPWPVHALGAVPAMLVVVWGLLEAAALVPLASGFLNNATSVVRAAAREAQLGIAGRVVLWVAVGATLGAGTGLADLPARLLALVAGMAAIPAAAGVGPFAPEQSLQMAGSEVGLDEPARPLLRLARIVRLFALLALVVVSSLPPLVYGSAVVSLGIMLLLIAGAGLALRRLRDLPRLTLPAGLRWCWLRALPPALVALAYTVLV